MSGPVALLGSSGYSTQNTIVYDRSQRDLKNHLSKGEKVALLGAWICCGFIVAVLTALTFFYMPHFIRLYFYPFWTFIGVMILGVILYAISDGYYIGLGSFMFVCQCLFFIVFYFILVMTDSENINIDIVVPVLLWCWLIWIIQTGVFNFIFTSEAAHLIFEILFVVWIATLIGSILLLTRHYKEECKDKSIAHFIINIELALVLVISLSVWYFVLIILVSIDFLGWKNPIVPADLHVLFGILGQITYMICLACGYVDWVGIMGIEIGYFILGFFCYVGFYCVR